MNKKNEKIMKYKKLLTIISFAIVIVVIFSFVISKIVGEKMPYYEVAVLLEDFKYDKNPKTMKLVGDVVVIQNKDFAWSKNDSEKYLILKMDITEDQSRKLIIPKQIEIPYDELSEEERENIQREEESARENGEDYEYEPRTEILAPREYRINLEKVGNLRNIDLTRGQPFFKKVYDWDIVEERE